MPTLPGLRRSRTTAPSAPSWAERLEAIGAGLDDYGQSVRDIAVVVLDDGAAVSCLTFGRGGWHTAQLVVGGRRAVALDVPTIRPGPPIKQGLPLLEITPPEPDGTRWEFCSLQLVCTKQRRLGRDSWEFRVVTDGKRPAVIARVRFEAESYQDGEALRPFQNLLSIDARDEVLRTLARDGWSPVPNDRSSSGPRFRRRR